MFKLLGLLLLSSLTVVPAASSFNQASFNNETQYVAKIDGDEGEGGEGGEEQTSYPYEDLFDEEYGTIVRYYKTDALTPTTSKRFCAPSGYKLVMNITDEQVDAIMNEMDSCFAEYTTMIDLVYYYYNKGSRITSSSAPHYINNRDEARDWIKHSINTLTLFEITELTEAADIKPEIEIEFYIDKSSESPYKNDYQKYLFEFTGGTIHFEPYTEFDFIDIHTQYIEGSNERRLTVYAEAIPGFFKEFSYNPDACPSYNDSGFETDTTTPISEGSEDYYADCEFTILGDDIPLIMERHSWCAAEMTFPSYNMLVVARLKFVSKGVTYTYYSRTITIGDPKVSVAVDNYPNRTSIQRGVEHKFSLYFNETIFPGYDTPVASAYLLPYRLHDEDFGHELYETGRLPETGITGHYYYLPTEEEIALYDAEEFDALNSMHYQGAYYTWNAETSSFDHMDDILLFETQYELNEETGWYEVIDGEIEGVHSAPYIGKWVFAVQSNINCYDGHYMGRVESQTIDVVVSGETNGRIIVSVPENGEASLDIENINLVAGIGAIDVSTRISSYVENTDYYYSYELNREGVVELTDKGNGIISINPVNYGVVQLTIGVESAEFSKITKTITIRVLDSVYDVAKVVVPDEFHKAGKELTASVDIRGFIDFQNLDVDWEVTNKKGDVLSEKQIRKNGNASVTILNPDSDDYTFTASYEGVELGKLTVQVRYVDMNKFLRTNIWWIVLITLSFLALMVFFATVTKRSKSTVDRIERVYGVYCQCISNDSLSKEELVRIKREITRCLHSCEDLNIDAFNQYEKSTRYLRKSLGDVKSLMKNYDVLTEGEKSVMYERLNADLGKALNVAKEIENAKGLIDQYHSKANKQNYEILNEDKPNKKEK